MKHEFDLHVHDAFEIANKALKHFSDHSLEMLIEAAQSELKKRSECLSVDLEF